MRLTDAFTSRGPVQIPPTRVPQGPQERATDSTALLVAGMEEARVQDGRDLELLAKLIEDRLDELDKRTETAKWTPRIFVATTEFTGTYSADQGFYRRVRDFVKIVGWVRTSTNVVTANQALSIGNLPYAELIDRETLDYWHCDFEQNSLLAGGVYGRLQPAAATLPRNIVINDSAQQLGTTLWTFNTTVYFAFMAEYRITQA